MPPYGGKIEFKILDTENMQVARLWAPQSLGRVCEVGERGGETMGNEHSTAEDVDDPDYVYLAEVAHILGVVALAGAAAVVDAAQGAEEREPRQANQHRDREYAVKQIAQWPDVLFERMFRICREDFMNLRQSLIERGFRPRNEAMGVLSSGSCISLETRMFITLRLLAGAAYLDLVWYNVALNHVHNVMFEVLECMDTCALLDNIKFPQTAAACRSSVFLGSTRDGGGSCGNPCRSRWRGAS